ncbi:MAG TPA: hypothetical protein VFS98_00505 [Methylomirabilota bacterium]|nr:hypothetical protein [Methylomirabilota bacterium]
MNPIRALTLCVGMLLAAAGPVPGRGEAAERLVGVGQPAPEITGGPWINSGPLSLGGLRGRVVLVEFWTYG